MAWFNAVVTQPYGLPYEPNTGGHSGIDLGTPNNTPLYLPYNGTIIEADYKPWGGQIAVLTAQGMMTFLHTNEIDVKPGQAYHAGEILGTSGGGVGDKVLYNGQLITATNQAQFSGYSTGYHTHFSVFNTSTLAGISAALGANVNRLNPTPFIQSFIASNPIMSTTPGTATTTDGTTTAAPVTSTVDFASLFNFSSWGQKTGVFLLALIFIGGGFYVLFSQQINEGVNTGVKTAAKVALV